jgi:hypothetical protein
VGFLISGGRKNTREGEKNEAFFTALRGCDFFDFSQKAALKTTGLDAKKSSYRNKVTSSQNDSSRQRQQQSKGNSKAKTAQMQQHGKCKANEGREEGKGTSNWRGSEKGGH